MTDATGAALGGVAHFRREPGHRRRADRDLVRSRDGRGPAVAGRRLHADGTPLRIPSDVRRVVSSRGRRDADDCADARSLAVPHEVVHVTADAVSLRTATGAVAEVFDGRLLTMTPVASRDVGEYAWQAPGAAPPAPGSRLSGEGGTPANVAGARETVEQLPPRWRRQQRPVPEPRARDPEPRRGAGVHAADQHLRRTVRPKRRRAGQCRGEVGRRSTVRIDLRLLPRSRARGARAVRSRSGAGTVPAAPSGRRDGRRPAARGSRVSTSSASRARAIARPRRGSRACRLRRSGPATSAPCRSRSSTRRQVQPFPGNRIPASRFDPTGARSRGAVSAAESARRGDEFRLVARWSAQRLAGHDEDRSSTGHTADRFSRATASSTTTRTIRSRRLRRTCQASARGRSTTRRILRSVSVRRFRTACSTSFASAGIAWRATSRQTIRASTRTPRWA